MSHGLWYSDIGRCISSNWPFDLPKWRSLNLTPEKVTNKTRKRSLRRTWCFPKKLTAKAFEHWLKRSPFQGTCSFTDTQCMVYFLYLYINKTNVGKYLHWVSGLFFGDGDVLFCRYLSLCASESWVFLTCCWVLWTSKRTGRFFCWKTQLLCVEQWGFLFEHGIFEVLVCVFPFVLFLG